MGVKGLWRLLLPIGRRISLETLEGRILAVDASIWLTQFLKAMRDPTTGKVLPAAHLKGFFHRLCRLAFHGIQPVFVFDGPTPAIKQYELQQRRKRREQFAKLDQAALQRLAKRLLAETLKKKEKERAKRKQNNSNNKTPPIDDKQDNHGTNSSRSTKSNRGNDVVYAEGFYPGGKPDVTSEKKSNVTTEKKSSSSLEETTTQEAPTAANAEKASTPSQTITTTNTTTSAEDEAAILAAIQEDMWQAEQEQQQALNDRERNKNDFEAPILQDTSSLEEEADAASDSNNDGRPFRTNASQRRGGRRRRRPGFDHNDFNDHETTVKQISTLPSHERKDIIEEVKRRQRLQSRKEYMPAAALPGKFSTVQLENFLKSSQFNLRVQRMAATTVEDDNNNDDGNEAATGSQKQNATIFKNKQQPRSQNQTNLRRGQRQEENVVMASDRTTRISLIREGDMVDSTTTTTKKLITETSRYASKQGLSLLQKAPPQNHVAAVRPEQPDNPSSKKDDESDIDWEDGEGGRGVAAGGVIRDSSSENDGSMIGKNQTNTRRNHPNSSHFNNTNNQIRLPHSNDFDMEQGENGGGGGGGFLTAEGEGGFLPMDQGGGFLPSNINQADVASETAASSKTPVGESELIILKDDSSAGSLEPPQQRSAQKTTKQREQQEQQDRALAQALQDMEDTASYGSQNSTKAVQGQEQEGEDCGLSNNNNNHGYDRLDDTDEDNYDRKPAAKVIIGSGPFAAMEGGLSDNDLDDADWQDGNLDNDTKNKSSTEGHDISHSADTDDDDDRKPAAKVLEKKVTLEEDESISENESNIDWEDGEGDVNHDDQRAESDAITGHVETSNETMKRAETMDSKAGEEKTEHMAWNENQNQQDYGNDGIFKSESTRQSSQSGGSKNAEVLEYPSSTRSSEYWDDEFNGGFTYHKKKTLSDDDDRDVMSSPVRSSAKSGRVVASDHESMETRAVMQRAQATASSLADWAGRAFRRAIREIGDGSEDQKRGPDQDAKTKSTPEESDSGEGENDDDGDDDDESVVELSSPSWRKNQVGVSSSSSSPSKPATPQVRDGGGGGGGGKFWNDFEEGGHVPTEITEDLLRQWESERNQRERDADTVTDEMKEEAMRLLRLFGIPYIEAPAEAEAQCVALEELKLVDGIVTEDSDVFVFGGRRVYKNIFEEKQYTEAYMADDAEKEMGLSRNALVAIAMLLGSDYTRGVRGVGIVNAMEILQEFDVSADLKSGLAKFAAWLDGFGLQNDTPDSHGVGQDFFEKHKSARSRWIMPPNFPSDSVMQAYMNPVVDKSKERFSWGTPDVEGLVVFCAKHIGWSADETRKMLEPVVSKSGQRYRQTRLDSFMKYEDGIKFADVRSKRLRAVLGFSSNEEKETKRKKNA